ncbi:MAG TPA: hypothetical protein VF245_12775 [Solirubrobacterales bacterium]
MPARAGSTILVPGGRVVHLPDRTPKKRRPRRRPTTPAPKPPRKTRPPRKAPEPRPTRKREVAGPPAPPRPSRNPYEALERAEKKLARHRNAELREATKRLRHALASEAKFKASRKTPEGSPMKANFPDRRLKKVAPRAYKKSLRIARGPHGSSRGLGEPEDLTTAITIAAPGGGFVGALGKRAVEVGGKTVLKEVGEAAAGKIESTALKAETRAVRAGSGVKAAGRLASRAARKVAGKEASSAERAAARAAAKRAAAKAASRESRFAQVSLPGVKLGKVAGAQTLPVVRGHEQAIVHSPKKVAKRTVIGAEGLVLGPVKAAADVATSGGRAVSSVAHTAGIPGFRGYSGAEIAAPIKGLGKEQLDFAKQVAKVVTASDSKEVQKEVEDNLGLMLPIVLGLGAKAGGERLTKGRVVEGVRKIANRARREPLSDFRGKTPRVFEKAGQHKAEAVRVANAKARARRDEQGATGRYVHQARGAKGGEVVRRGVRPQKGRLARATSRGLSKAEAEGHLVVRPADVIPFATRHSIDLSNPARAIEQVKAHRASLEPLPEGATLPASKLHTRDLLDYIERNADVLANPRVRKALEERRKAGAYRRKHAKELAPEHSERARYSSVATVKRRPLPEHMFPKDVRDLVRAEPKHGVLAKDVLRREAREDHAQARNLKRSARTLVRQAEKRAEGAKRRVLRAQAAEREVQGVAKLRVSQADRKLLRQVPEYVDAVRNNNRAQKTLREARTRYGNFARNGQGLYRHGQVSAQAKVIVNGLKAAERQALETRAQLDRVKGHVLARAHVETGRAARGEQAGPLAGLGRGPRGTLAQLEHRGGKVAQAQAEHTARTAELARARELAAERVAEAKGYAHMAKLKHRASQGFDPSLEAEFVAREAADLRAEGRPQPEYVHTGRAREAPGYGTTGAKLSQFPGKSKFRKGTAERYGMVEEGLVPDIRESFRRPAIRRESYRALRGMLNDNEFRVSGKDEWTSNEIRELFNEGVLDRRQWVAVPRQLYKRAYGKFDPEVATAEIKLALDGKAPGTHFKLVRKPAADQFFSQLSDALVSSKLVKVNRATNFLILATSPSWAAAQVAAEYVQGSIAQPRLLNPRFVKKAMRAYKAMPPHKRQAFDAWVGVTARELSRKEEMGFGTVEDAADAYSAFHSTPLGKLINSIHDFDQWKGGRIRTLVAIAKADKELNGHLNRFVRGLGKLDEQMGKQLKAMRGKPLEEQLAFIGDHPKLAHRYQTYLDDVMGNWTALTKNERVASQLMIFYPFLRMSLRWTFYAFPKHHPIRAATLAYLSQQNAVQVKRLLGGDPSYFTAWMKVPVNLGHGKVAWVPLARIVPGANAPLEAIGGGIEGPKGTVALRTAQPVLGAAATLATGVNPLTGKQEKGSFWSALEQLFPTSLSAPGRALNEVLIPSGRKPGEGLGKVSPIFGTERQEALDKLSAKLVGYGSAERYARGLVAPLLPEAGDKVKDKEMLGRIMRALERNSPTVHRKLASDYADKIKNLRFEGKGKAAARLRAEAERRFEGMEKTYDEANNLLDAMFEKWKVPFKKEDNIFLEEYGRLEYGTEPKEPTSIGGTSIGGAPIGAGTAGQSTVGGVRIKHGPGRLSAQARNSRQTTIGGVPVR